MSTTTAPPAPAPAKRRRHTWADLYHERTHFQFIERSWRWALLSGSLILISVVAFAINGLNLGIDFEGGTQWQFTVASGRGSADVSEVRDALDPVGLADAKVLIVGDKSVRVQSEDLSRAKQAKVSAALAEYAGIPEAQVSLTNVGPTWGDKVSSKALTALLVFFLVIAAYLTFRFEWRMAVAAIVAVVHDIIITIGVYAVTAVRGDPGDGRRLPHHPRILPVRHRGRVRQGEGQPGASRHRAGRHLLDDGEPVAQPGADALDQHLDRGAAPGGVVAVRRYLRVRRAGAA